MPIVATIKAMVLTVCIFLVCPERPRALGFLLGKISDRMKVEITLREIIMPIENEEQFQVEKAQLIAQAEAATKRYEEVQAQTQQLKLDAQFETAYREAGGSADGEAIELLKSFFGERMRIENGQQVFLDKYGMVELGENGPKTFAEKMAEVSKTSAFKHCFTGDSTSSQADSNSQQTYKREDAQSGKASMNDIASGKIKLEGVDDTRAPDTKVINASEIAKTKSRRWK